MSRILQYLSFGDWLFSRSAMLSRLTYVVACITTSFLFMATLALCGSLHLLFVRVLMDSWIAPTFGLW